ncbi:hypothetical protein AGABI1DRAFT_129130 [Agaricus bisporus var. burnettii JB137-S8]|uniref:G-protein coupled receptors family 1 profile domain-containing protein n=2 Tax=Agaricus bisporus var. burnettii TaxID=192524 RepID=K5WTT3_AGABU|nr:uncharacterized protein AGABI1DRAFT_129130 [Agaricus bisporus var. burnettii JB137-S8]EKM78851.1 hypothetical protein AGABI1DRAFT_129130 [Agaricus bisporus var. burnettii JB137-S8]KAF7771610.1 hypothetical protein Agabi119p4_5921 [Agaricus bisporus var. burnettii]
MDVIASPTPIALFDAITVLSLVFLLVIVATAYFSPHVQRRKVWYGQKVQWITYCVSYMLLFGFQYREPPRALCLLQSNLIYACPPACAVASACFMIDFYVSLGPLHQLHIRNPRRLELLLIILPWLTLALNALHVALFVVFSSEEIRSTQWSPGNPFCHIPHMEPTIVSATLVILAAFIALYFEVQSGMILYSNRLEFRHLKYKAIQGYLSLYIRSAILTIGMIIAIAISVYSVSGNKSGLGSWSLALPFMPMFVAIVFGSQMDIIRAWLFWRKRDPEDEDLTLMSQISITLETVSVRNSAHFVT